MGLTFLLALSSPVLWLLIASLASMCRRGKTRRPRRYGLMRGAALDVGAAFLFLAVAYRPSHAFLVQAQIRQMEKVDEDSQGGPDSPLRHFHRQLQKIRNGEPLERLLWWLQGARK
jgi:hypothetical protein